MQVITGARCLSYRYLSSAGPRIASSSSRIVTTTTSIQSVIPITRSSSSPPPQPQDRTQLQRAIAAFIRNEWMDIIVSHTFVSSSTGGNATTSSSTARAALESVARSWGASGVALIEELSAAGVDRAALVSAARGTLLIDMSDARLVALCKTFSSRLTSAALASRALPRSKYFIPPRLDDTSNTASVQFLQLPPHVKLTAITTLAQLQAAVGRAHVFAARVRAARVADGGGGGVDAFVALDTESRPSLPRDFHHHHSNHNNHHLTRNGSSGGGEEMANTTSTSGGDDVALAQIFICSPPGVGSAVPENDEILLVDIPRLCAVARAGGEAGKHALRSTLSALFSPTGWEPDTHLSVPSADLAKPPCLRTLVFGNTDIALLSATHAAFFDTFHAPTASILDVQALASVTSDRGRNVGLSSLCAAIIGAPLEKSSRMSDWLRRPLLPAQAQYAAIDAWVLPRLARALLPINDDGIIENN